MRRFNRIAGPMLLTLGVMTCAGCQEGPAIGYYLGRPAHVARLNRVVFVELSGQESCPGVAEDMTTALSHAIQARRLFRIDVVSRDETLCHGLSLDGRGGFTMKQLKDMRQAFQCDAVLVGSVKDFRPHPRTQVGLYLRLLDVKNGRLVWAVDHVWDTTDKVVEKRIKRFFDSQMRDGFEPMNWEFAMISPKAFGKFVAYEVAETLPDATKPGENKRVRRWVTLEKSKIFCKKSQKALSDLAARRQ